jgi:hypothetical protein
MEKLLKLVSLLLLKSPPLKVTLSPKFREIVNKNFRSRLSDVVLAIVSEMMCEYPEWGGYYVEKYSKELEEAEGENDQMRL